MAVIADTGLRAHWSSRLAFVLAAVGAAVGLGNIWKFPYMAGVNGGAAFVLVYIGAVLVVAVPLLIAELLIGRRGQKDPPQAVAALARETGSSPAWQSLGWLGVITAFVILSFYSVVGGWVLAYIPKVLSGEFAGIERAGTEASFGRLLADPVALVLWQTLFLVLTAFIVARGVRRGIERAVMLLMPSLFVMLLGVVAYAAVAGDMAAALAFLLQADFSRITPQVALAAVGHAFFSIGVGMAIMITYGSYLSREVSLPRSALVIVTVDTAVALLAGLAIFPLVFANHLNPTEGPGLIFVTLPIAFGHMPGGTLVGAVFFLLLAFAALTSSIAILEPIVSWTEERLRARRARAAIFWAAIAWVCGLGSVFSFNLWSDVHLLGSIQAYTDKTLFDLLDHFTTNLMLPLAGILAALFVGWRIPATTLRSELGQMPRPVLRLWVLLLRYVVPALLLVLIVIGIV